MRKNKVVAAKLQCDARDALSKALGDDIAAKLVRELTAMRLDLAAGRLGNAAPGRFIECVVQALTKLTVGSVDLSRNVQVATFFEDVDKWPKTMRHAPLAKVIRPVALAVYALRNKRGIGHTSELDPALMDLRLLLVLSQWIVAEFVRVISGLRQDDAAKAVEAIQVLPSRLVQDFGTHKALLPRSCKPSEELLLILATYAPEPVSEAQLKQDTHRLMWRRVKDALRYQVAARNIEPVGDNLYSLTDEGLRLADKLARTLLEEGA